MSDWIEAHQALYGYRDGHRLLESSTRLLPEVQRSLRSLTDTSFIGGSGPYLAIHPLPAQRMQAFIRTWPAPDWIRPGSVWSHVLLIGDADVARLEGTASLRRAFREPQLAGRQLTTAAFEVYGTPVPVNTTEHVDVLDLDPEFLATVLYGLYGTTETVRLQVRDAAHVESVLLAVYEQQWPRLRRAFAGRTRGRSSTSLKLDLEFLESRPRGIDETGRHLGDRYASWVQRAASDLIKPNAQYRSFLYLGGAESSLGRRDFAALTHIYDEAVVRSDAPKFAVDLIARSYPSPTSHRALKRALFGPAAADVAPSQWPTTEADRIALAFNAGSAVDFGDLNIGQRLVEMHRESGRTAEPLGEVDVQALGAENVTALVSAITANADHATALSVALTQPDLGLLIVAQNPVLLSEPALWDSLDSELLVDLLHELPDRREKISADLLDRRATEALTRLCATFPDQWWDLLRQAANAETSLLIERAQTLRLVLERMGTAALDSPTIRPQSPLELVALLLAADLSSGLWRRARVADWVASVSAPIETLVQELPHFALERLYAVVLVGAAGGTSVAHRRSAWAHCFGFLHQALASPNYDEEAWRLLSTTLPAGPAWDRCHLLRLGAATEIRRDQWGAPAVRSLLAEARPHDADLLNLLREQSNQRNRKDSVLRSLMKLLK